MREERARGKLWALGAKVVAIFGLVVLGTGCGAGSDSRTSEAVARVQSALDLTRSARGIAAGRSHACAIVFGGQVKCWGSSASGQLGLGDTITRGDGPGEMGWKLPSVNLGSGRSAIALAAGNYHTCALLDNGSVKCWGLNMWGQLGLGDTAARGDGPGEMGDALPSVNLGTGRTAKAIAAGGFHSCALLDDNSLKCWGMNAYGELGLGDARDRGDGPNQMGDQLPSVNLGTGRTAKVAVLGAYHTCAILDNGSVKCWGLDDYGELGLDDTVTRGDGPGEMGDALPAVNLGASRSAKLLALGEYHSCALLDNGDVKCWGRNHAGQLGLGDALSRGDNAGEMAALTAVSVGAGRTVVDLASGSSHVCVLFKTGGVKCWGSSGYGQLGLGDQVTRGDGPGEMGDSLPAVSLGSGVRVIGLSLGFAVSCARFDDDSLKCWGANDSGQLGLGDLRLRGDAANFMGDSLPRIDLGRATKSLALGQSHVCAILDNDELKCWGGAWLGQILGQSTLSKGDNPGEMGANLAPIALVAGHKPVSVTAGWEHSCALLDDGRVKCWGGNSFGQLGFGDTSARGDEPGETGLANAFVNLGTGRTAVSLRAGGFHTCAILDNGLLKCWGKNTYGQLGIGSVQHRGDNAGEMGDSLPAVDLGPGRTAREVFPGWGHTCALLDDNSLKCWGGNGVGQLGLGDQSARGDAPGEMGAALPAVNLGTGRSARSVSCWYTHTCAVLDNGLVKCWGANESGQLGLGDSANRGDNAGEMGDSLPFLALGTSRKALSLATARTHTCAQLDNGSVKCWGDSAFGQLGQGDSVRRGDNAGEMGDALASVALIAGRAATSLAAGGFFTCASLDNSQIKCWGDNSYGQLGQGDVARRGNAPNQMGAALPAVPTGSLASKFLSSDANALAILEGFPYDLNDPALFTRDAKYDTTSFGYKLLSAFNMLGMSTITFQPAPNPRRPQLFRLHEFQQAHGFPVEDLLRPNVLLAIDAALVTREASLAQTGPTFPLYSHIEPLASNAVSKDQLATLYALPMNALPASLQMNPTELLNCINSQCVGFIYDANGNEFPGKTIDPNSDYHFLGYSSPYLPGEDTMFSASIVVQVVLHEYAHYLDNPRGAAIDPNRPHLQLILSNSFHNLSYDMSQVQDGCAPPRSSDPQNWITAYGKSSIGCTAPLAAYGEEFAEAFASYVAQGRRFRAAALLNSVIAQKYAWLKSNVFQGIEYDTDLQRNWEAGCNDVIGASGRVPGYLSCSEQLIWDGTLPRLP